MLLFSHLCRDRDRNRWRGGQTSAAAAAHGLRLTAAAAAVDTALAEGPAPFLPLLVRVLLALAHRERLEWGPDQSATGARGRVAENVVFARLEVLSTASEAGAYPCCRLLGQITHRLTV